MIEVRNISKSFNGKTIISDISITFETGKTNLIIGQSGSGKTVLLKSVAGLFEVDAGSILYDGRDFTRMTKKERLAIRREVGMLFQGSALFNSATVEENVMFPLNMFTDMSVSEKKARVDFCLNRVNIADANKKFPSELSGGMQKRVAIARAIVQNPSYLFCDEPNSGLDPQTSLVIDKLISEITHEFGMTTIINTHDMNSVMEIGEKVLFIHQGKVNWEGNSSEVFSADNDNLERFIFASSFTRQARESLERQAK